MNPVDIPLHLLNKPEDKNKFFMDQGVRPKQLLMEGITIGIDLMTINIPYRPLGMTSIDLSGELTSMQFAEQAHHKKQFMSHIYEVRTVLMEIYEAKPTKKEKDDKTATDRLRVLCADDGSHVTTVTVGLCFGTPVISYSFNPNKLTDAGLIEFDVLLSMTLPHGYGSLYTEGVISRCEFYIDVDGVPYGSLALLDKGKRRTTRYDDTTYNGTRHSDLVGAMYNKAEQLKINAHRTRIETRIRQRDVTLQQVVESGIKNPLSPFLVVPASALTLIANEWEHDPTLANRIAKDGLYGGIKNPSARKAVTKRLEELVVPWWDPEKIWASFQQTMSVLRPNYCFGMSDGCFPKFETYCH